MKTLALVFVLLVTAAIPVFAQCPSIAVIGPTGLTNPGEEIEFRAALVGDRSGLRFAWSVNRGTIIRGSGTPQITVATEGSPEVYHIEATVTVEGFPEGCKN